jgi:hypothetical protein
MVECDTRSWARIHCRTPVVDPVVLRQDQEPIIEDEDGVE